MLIGGVLLAQGIFVTDHKPSVVETKPVVRHESQRERATTDEEIRPAVPSRTATENVPIRRALKVEDEPKPRK